MTKLTAQNELDALARQNSWQVDTAPGRSIYTRSSETVILRFSPSGTVTDADRVTSYDVNASDWQGLVGNVLRRRWRTYTPSETRNKDHDTQPPRVPINQEIEQ